MWQVGSGVRAAQAHLPKADYRAKDQVFGVGLDLQWRETGLYGAWLTL